MKTFLLFAALALSGCESLKVPDRFATATAVACLEEEDRRKLEASCPAPRSDEDLLALDDYKAVQALRLERGQAALCRSKLQAAIAACAKVPAAASSSGRSAGIEAAPAEIPPAPILTIR